MAMVVNTLVVCPKILPNGFPSSKAILVIHWWFAHSECNHHGADAVFNRQVSTMDSRNLSSAMRQCETRRRTITSTRANGLAWESQHCTIGTCTVVQWQEWQRQHVVNMANVFTLQHSTTAHVTTMTPTLLLILLNYMHSCTTRPQCIIAQFHNCTSGTSPSTSDGQLFFQSSSATVSIVSSHLAGGFGHASGRHERAKHLGWNPSATHCPCRNCTPGDLQTQVLGLSVKNEHELARIAGDQ